MLYPQAAPRVLKEPWHMGQLVFDVPVDVRHETLLTETFFSSSVFQTKYRYSISLSATTFAWSRRACRVELR